jgi:hypothetical protein
VVGEAATTGAGAGPTARGASDLGNDGPAADGSEGATGYSGDGCPCRPYEFGYETVAIPDCDDRTKIGVTGMPTFAEGIADFQVGLTLPWQRTETSRLVRSARSVPGYSGSPTTTPSSPSSRPDSDYCDCLHRQRRQTPARGRRPPVQISTAVPNRSDGCETRRVPAVAVHADAKRAVYPSRDPIMDGTADQSRSHRSRFRTAVTSKKDLYSKNTYFGLVEK